MKNKLSDNMARFGAAANKFQLNFDHSYKETKYYNFLFPSHIMEGTMINTDSSSSFSAAKKLFENKG